MDIERLIRLSKIDFNFPTSENNVKYNIVIPFLQAFNHIDLHLEHAAQGSRIDINIGNGRTIIETKALDINLDMYVQQLANYSGRELPALAILTNGKYFRIYSPKWRRQRTFAETLIYEFGLKDLNQEYLLNRLEKILDFTNYKNEIFLDYIEEREREIIRVKKEIEDLYTEKQQQEIEVKSEIEDMKEDAKKINEQIQFKEQTLTNINSNKIPEIENKISEYFIPQNKFSDKPVSSKSNFKNPIQTNSTENLNAEAIYKTENIKSVEQKKNQAPYELKNFFDELDKRICEVSPEIKQKTNPDYYAYQAGGIKFLEVYIQTQKNGLLLYLKTKDGRINIPTGIFCEAVPKRAHANLSHRAFLPLKEIGKKFIYDDIINLVRQSLDAIIK